jgi:hypothetical protein
MTQHLIFQGKEPAQNWQFMDVNAKGACENSMDYMNETFQILSYFYHL